MSFPEIDVIVFPAILVYLVTAITELVSSIPVGIVVGAFKGECVLSASVTMEFDLFLEYGLKVSFGNSSLCGFCTYLTVITFVFAILYGGYALYAVWISTDNAAQMWVLPALLVNSLLLILKFVSSLILSIGVSNFCSSVAASVGSCEKGQEEVWFNEPNQSLQPDDNQILYDGSGYFGNLNTAQSASWICVIEWLVLVILTALHYRRNILRRSRNDNEIPATASDKDVHLPGSASVVNPNYNPNFNSEA